MPVPSRSITLLAVVLLAASVVGWLVAAQPGPRPREALPLAAAGYPPPPGAPTDAPTAAPPPSPTPEMLDGYFPPPDGIEHRVEPLDSSAYRDLLATLQSAIDAGAPDPPAAWVSERFGNRLFDIRLLDSESGVTLDRPMTRAVLGAFLDQGARPRIQGYFAVDDGEIACLDVMTALYQGDVPWPATPEAFGPRPPETVPPDAAAFHACRDQAGQWLWQGWAYGGYHELVATYAALHGASGAPYIVTRP